MASKHELSISTGYVPTWGIVEAFRELFQNAIDNETNNPDNKMSWNYNNGTVRISNKTSKLTTDSLLLGTTTKADDKETIGKYGEGYKIAIMILLRNNKNITIYNYGAREIWTTRLVNSRKYNGAKVHTIFVEKEAVWKKTPDNDLTIEVTGVTEEEYKDIVNKNLHLRGNTISKFNVPNRGDIILNKEEAGNIYVRGLYVTSIPKLQYGYDFEPQILGLDRDRKLVDTFNVTWESSILWQFAANADENLKDVAVEMFNNKKMDVNYINSMNFCKSTFCDAVATNFYEENGDSAVPVTTTSEYEVVKSNGHGTPIIVDEKKAAVIRESSVAKDAVTIKVITIKEQLSTFIDKIEDRLSDEELEEVRELVGQVNN